MTPRRVRVCAVISIAGFLSVLSIAPVGAQDPSRHLRVEPATGLENQVVHVSWSGFAPTVDGANTVTLYQCRGAVPASLQDCYTDFSPPVTEFGTATDQATTGPDGTGGHDLEVRPGLQLPKLGCSSRNPCSIVAYENDGTELPTTGLPATAVTARLDFAPSPSDCPKVTTPDVATAGEGSAAHAMYAWSARVCSGSHPLSLDYTESSSPEGRDNFLKGLVDVGLTSTAPTAAEIAAGTKRPFALAPIDLTGVVVAFNVWDTVTHERITDMNLTPRLVAIMIAGGQFGGPGQSLFSDPEFVANNPGHHWPERADAPLLRSERNADALLLTSWLNADPAARAFLDGKDPTAEVDPFWKNVAYPSDVFEARDPSTIGSYNPRSGTLTNARRLFNFQPPGDATISPLNEGLLGVMDAVTARTFGFPTARIRPAGSTDKRFVAADTLGLLAGYHAMNVATDKVTRVADPTAPGAYPLVKIDYALVPTSGLTPAKAGNIGRFLEYAAGGGQAPGVLAPGYVPLPAELRAQTATVQRLVVAGGGGPAPRPATGQPRPPATGSPNTATGSGSGSFATGSFADTAGGLFTGSDAGTSSDGFGGQISSGTSGSSGASTDSNSPSPSTVAPLGLSGRSAGATDGRSAASTGTAQPIGLFGGADGQRVLPALLGSGITALLLGPALSVWARRRNRSTARHGTRVDRSTARHGTAVQS